MLPALLLSRLLGTRPPRQTPVTAVTHHPTGEKSVPSSAACCMRCSLVKVSSGVGPSPRGPRRPPTLGEPIAAQLCSQMVSWAQAQHEVASSTTGQCKCGLQTSAWVGELVLLGCTACSRQGISCCQARHPSRRHRQPCMPCHRVQLGLMGCKRRHVQRPMPPDCQPQANPSLSPSPAAHHCQNE